jgi:hypothetical protein
VGNVLIFDAVGAIQVNVRSIAGARAVLAPAASESSSVASVSLKTGFTYRPPATSSSAGKDSCLAGRHSPKRSL